MSTEWFVSQYATDGALVEERYCHMQMRGTLITTSRKYSELVRLRMFVDGERARVDRDIDEWSNGEHSQRQIVRVASPHLSFMLYRPNDESPYVIRELDTTTDGYNHSLDLINTHAMYGRAAYCIREIALGKFLTQAPLALSQVSQANGIVKVEFHTAGTNQGRAGWCELLEERWVLSAWRLQFNRSPKPLAIDTRIDYTYPDGGIPALKRVHQIQHRNGTQIQEQTFVVEELRFDDPPDSAFKLSEFGLPNLSEDGDHSMFYGKVLIGIGTVMVIVAAIVWSFWNLRSLNRVT